MSNGALSGHTGNKDSIVVAGGTPETYLLSCDKGKLDKDAVFCAIDRACATLKLLDLQFNGDDCERLSDETIQNALWGVEGHLDQIKILLEHQ